MSETFGREDKPWHIPSMDGYKCTRTERSGGDKGGGGLCIYTREQINAHHWTPSINGNFKHVENERQWILFDNGRKRLAFLHCYLACQTSRNDDFLEWNEILFELLTTEVTYLKNQGFVILCMGDFNSRVGCLPGLEGNRPDVNRNGPMFIQFVEQCNLTILNTLPIAKGLFTRFWSCDERQSKSVLDYGLVDSSHTDTVTSFIIDKEARFDCGTDHALLTADVTFGKRSTLRWRLEDVIQYDIKPSTDFSAYKEELDRLSATYLIHEFEDLSLEKQLAHIKDCITESGKNKIGLKTHRKKKPQKLPKSLIIKEEYNTFDNLL